MTKLHELRTNSRRGCSDSSARALCGAAPVTSALVTIVALAVVLPLVFLPILPAAFAALLLVVVVVLVGRRLFGELIAGVTLLVAQPYTPGEKIRLYADDVHEVIDAEVLHVGLLETTLCGETGMISVPNTRLLRATPDAAAA